MKIKVKVCTEKHIVEARTIVLDTEEYPRLQEMIDNGELKDISNGGEYPEGGRFWRLEWTDTSAKDFLVDAWQITDEDEADEVYFEEHFDIDESWAYNGIVWENESDQCPLVVGYVPVVEEE